MRAAHWNWNAFARALAANYSAREIAAGFFVGPRAAGWGASRAQADALNGGAGRALLGAARAALDAMPFFVLVERYDESVALLRHATCWRAPAYRETDGGGGGGGGVSSPRARLDALPAEVDAAARRYLALDMELLVSAAHRQATFRPNRSSRRQ